MFDRVSTIDLVEYFDFPIYVGKKWTGGFTNYSGSLFQSEPNWLTNFTGNQPEYEFPDDLPNWVLTKNQGYDVRKLIGDGTGTIGPFTLKEALYIYSVVRRHTFTGNQTPPSASGSAGSASASVTLGDLESSLIKERPAPTKPKDLFRPQDFVESIRYFKMDENSDSSNTGNFSAVSVTVGSESRLLFSNVSGNYIRSRVIIDVDNLSDYYIDLDPASFYSYSSATAYEEGVVTINEQEYLTDESSFAYKYESISLDLVKGDRDVGESWSEIYDDTNLGGSENYEIITNDRTYTVITTKAQCKFGDITKEVNLYGLKIQEDFSYKTLGFSGEPVPPIPEVSVNVPVSNSFVFGADQYWPYKNASGQPVYNTETGAIINSPIP